MQVFLPLPTTTEPRLNFIHQRVDQKLMTFLCTRRIGVPHDQRTIRHLSGIATRAAEDRDAPQSDFSRRSQRREYIRRISAG